MTVITIRNVPEELNEQLKARARERGQSLRQFLLRELVDVAQRSPLEDRLCEVLSPLSDLPLSSDEVRVALDEARLARDSRLADLTQASRQAR
jgi:plasmid stability protein